MRFVSFFSYVVSFVSFFGIGANDRDYAYWRFTGAFTVEMQKCDCERKTWHCSSPAITHRRVLWAIALFLSYFIFSQNCSFSQLLLKVF